MNCTVDELRRASSTVDLSDIQDAKEVSSRNSRLSLVGEMVKRTRKVLHPPSHHLSYNLYLNVSHLVSVSNVPLGFFELMQSTPPYPLLHSHGCTFT